MLGEHARAPTSPRSTGFCAIWGCISSSSSSAPNHSQPPSPQSQRPAASNRANPRGTHRGPSTTQGLPPGSPPHHRHFPPSVAALYQAAASENDMVPRASRPPRPRQCPEVVQPNEWSDPHRRRASGPRSTWSRPRVGAHTLRPAPAARAALRRARTRGIQQGKSPRNPQRPINHAGTSTGQSTASSTFPPFRGRFVPGRCF